MSDASLFIRALEFAATRHSGQIRKGDTEEPYINHPISVAFVLSEVGGVADQAILAAALLHDTVEDTDTTLEELRSLFGETVESLVAELTDDKTLPKEERKLLQISHAPSLSADAKLLKLSDKICNLRDVVGKPPKDWSDERRREYLEWTAQVIAGCRGVNPAMEALYDSELDAGRESTAGS